MRCVSSHGRTLQAARFHCLFALFLCCSRTSTTILARYDFSSFFFALSLLLPIHYSRFSIFIFLLRCGLSRARSIVDMTIPICPVIGSTPPSHAACAQQLGYFKLLRHMHRALLPPSSPFPLCARRRRRRCSLALHVILVFTTFLTLLFTNGGTVRVFACVLDWLLRTQPVADTYM